MAMFREGYYMYSTDEKTELGLCPSKCAFRWNHAFAAPL